jgi:peroxiredoxin Q/BCP
MVKNEIEVGDKAPLFKLDSFNAGTIDLEHLIGKKKIVLIFSRYFGCPICQLDLNILLESVAQIKEKEAMLLYITQSGEKIANEFIQRYAIDFPVIPSTKKELYAEYGLGMMTTGAIAKVPQKLKEAKARGIEHGGYEGWERQGPGQFVIDENGIIIHARKGWLYLPGIYEVL